MAQSQPPVSGNTRPQPAIRHGWLDRRQSDDGVPTQSLHQREPGGPKIIRLR